MDASQRGDHGALGRLVQGQQPRELDVLSVSRVTPSEVEHDPQPMPSGAYDADETFRDHGIPPI
jgi:hypothetical protein